MSCAPPSACPLGDADGDAVSTKFRSLFDCAPQAILIADEAGHYVDANPAACELFGVQHQSLLGKTIFDFVQPEELQATESDWSRFKKKRTQTGTFTLSRPDGVVRRLHYSAVANFMPGLHLSFLHDISERLQVEAERGKDLETLRGQRDARERFVSTLTHDLRTPLTAARVSAELIVRSSADPYFVQKHAAKLISNIDRAEIMIRDLLDANLIQAGQKLSIRPETQDLVPLITSVLEDLSAVCGDRFRLESPGPVEACVDGAYLRRAVENLCGNAIKYGAVREPITIRTCLNGELFEIQVHNQGNPIAPEDQATLFQPFKRVSSPESSSQTGWGLGLTLVRGVAEAHGGTVRIESSTEHGTTFTLCGARSPQPRA